MKLQNLLALLFAAGVAAPIAAQPVQQPAPLAPAPLLGTGQDQEGRPIPFGIPPYFEPVTPLGSGPNRAIMTTDLSLPEHVIYRPANLEAAGRMPIISWGNGACIHAGNRFRSFLTEVASHGFLVISAGRMGHSALEVGPQENPAVLRPGESPPPAAAPPVEDRTAPWRALRSNADHLRQAIDWAIAENSRPGSPFYGRLDTSKIAVAGQSCGGGLATQAAVDPRVTAIGIFNSGTRLQPRAGEDAAMVLGQGQQRLDQIDVPVLFLSGEADLDAAFAGAQDSFNYLTDVPAIWAYQEGIGHIATYGARNGGSFGRIAADWFKWQLKDDPQAAGMFTGADCELCQAPGWTVERKNIP